MDQTSATTPKADAPLRKRQLGGSRVKRLLLAAVMLVFAWLAIAVARFNAIYQREMFAFLSYALGVVGVAIFLHLLVAWLLKGDKL
jgi:hypothetical protein